MNIKRNDGTYRAALGRAMEELDELFQEAREMRNQMERIESVLEALRPMIVASESNSESERYSAVVMSEQAQETAHAIAKTLKPMGEVLPPVTEGKGVLSDLIQQRIDSALGMVAVA
jgi:Spy/CpxP family protein refolding chaperone